MKILLSINPEHNEKILSGDKIYEYRKSIPANREVRTVVIYSTRPVSKIVGEFDIERIICDNPNRLWSQTAEGSGISEEFFYSYFADRLKAYAFKIGRVTKYDPPIDPSTMIKDFTPPQSFMYLDDEAYCNDAQHLQMRLL